MSQVKIQGNASGTGIFTIAAPNSNTDRTLTLPDATGTVQVSGAAISGTTGTFTGLVDISAAGAGQIKFPATMNASSDANTLDDYEEGTFTPTLNFGGATTGITYGGTRLGSYTKVGRMVYGAIRFQLTSKGSATGLATVTGLPFTCINTEGFNGGVWEAYAGNMSGWNVPKQFIIDIGSATIVLRYAGASTGTFFDNTNFTNTSDLILNFCYQVQ